MKTRLKFISLIFALILVADFACKDYLIEDNKTGATEDVIYSTKSGIDGLLAASYAYLHGWYGHQGGIYLSEGGCDIWLTGYDNQEKILADYSNITPDVVTSMNPMFDEFWELLYAAVNTCNTGIKNVEAISTSVLSESDKSIYIGEFEALRAFYYWHMVETWGPVQINREPVNSANTVAKRDSEEDVYTFMLSDIDDAITRLAGQTAKTGHINLWAAKALKARFLLYKASKFNDNQSYTDAAALANEVIDGSGLSLFSNYADCWNLENEKGTVNNEVIWWVENSDILENNLVPKRLKFSGSEQSDYSYGIIISGTTGGNAAHLYMTGVWNFLPALSTVFVRTNSEEAKILNYRGVDYNLGTSYQPYSKGYTEYVPSGYLLDLFNDATDQRYQASFQDTWYIAPALQAAFASGIQPPTGFANMRDTAIYMSKSISTPSGIISRASNRYVLFSRTDVGDPLVHPLYQDNAGTLPTIAVSSAGDENYKGNRMYIHLKKFDDLNGSIIRNLSDRDVFVIRLSEMYLIAAEGAMMSGQPGQGILMLNSLRTARAITGKSNVLTAAEESQVNNKDINVILDERARELCGEQQRWFDLKRTGKLVERVKLYNGSAKNNIQSFHALRPIPRPQLDATTNVTAGPDPNGFWQNPGY
jgi:hypothetical protein